MRSVCRGKAVTVSASYSIRLVFTLQITCQHGYTGLCWPGAYGGVSSLLSPGCSNAGGLGVDTDDDMALHYLQEAHDFGHWKAPYQVKYMLMGINPQLDYHALLPFD